METVPESTQPTRDVELSKFKRTSGFIREVSQLERK
jgi:hypothetical protein